MSQNILHTIGYEGHSLDSFVAALKKHGVATVVDVREMAFSRKTGFSQKELAAFLQQSGISYRHMPAVGCPKAIRDALQQGGTWQQYSEAFKAHLTKRTEAVAALAELASQSNCVLMCFEKEPERCHRMFVAEAVADCCGAQVEHIVADDSPQMSLGF